jgi:hypothetical protein
MLFGLWFLVEAAAMHSAQAQANIPRFGITPLPPTPSPVLERKGWIMLDRREKTPFSEIQETLKKTIADKKEAEAIAKKMGKNPNASKNSINKEAIGNVGGIGVVGSGDENTTATGGIGITLPSSHDKDSSIGKVGGLGKVGKE